VLISQDRHEVYLTFAAFDDDYVRTWLRDEHYLEARRLLASFLSWTLYLDSLETGQAFEEVKTRTTGDGLDRPTARQVCEMIVRGDPRLLTPYCEWGPSRFLYDICISSIDESDMFERKVVPNGCTTVRDIYKYASETYHGNIYNETAAIGKTFGPASDELHGGVTVSGRSRDLVP
jgi:hypothetical protein